MSILHKAQRLARLSSIPVEALGDEPPRQARGDHRPLTKDNRPVVDMRGVLEGEVERTRLRHEAACEDLRRYMLSHDATEARG